MFVHHADTGTVSSVWLEVGNIGTALGASHQHFLNYTIITVIVVVIIRVYPVLNLGKDNDKE